jgi:Polyketide cyclase / dehydrase and lipid transport
VYDVLTDYKALPRVFHNVEECSIQWSDDGQKQLSQRCSWRFLVFRGSFITDLAVSEGEEARTLEFSLVKSAFMRKFVGSWEVRPCSVTGGSEIWHSLAVQPALAPPKTIGELTKKIFVSQVEGILGDLAIELHRRSIDTDDDDSASTI